MPTECFGAELDWQYVDNAVSDLQLAINNTQQEVTSLWFGVWQPQSCIAVSDNSKDEQKACSTPELLSYQLRC